MGCSPSLSGQRGQPCRELSSWTAGSPALWRAPACSTRATTGQGCRRGSLGWCPEPGAPRRRRRSRPGPGASSRPLFEDMDKILMMRTKHRIRQDREGVSIRYGTGHSTVHSTSVVLCKVCAGSGKHRAKSAPYVRIDHHASPSESWHLRASALGSWLVGWSLGCLVLGKLDLSRLVLHRPQRTGTAITAIAHQPSITRIGHRSQAPPWSPHTACTQRPKRKQKRARWLSEVVRGHRGARSTEHDPA